MMCMYYAILHQTLKSEEDEMFREKGKRFWGAQSQWVPWATLVEEEAPEVGEGLTGLSTVERRKTLPRALEMESPFDERFL